MPSRLLHPLAWWLWAGGMAVAANRIRNPLLLVVLVAAVVLVAELRAEDRERRMTLFLWLAGLVVGVRLLAQALFGGGAVGTTVLFRLPELPLPDWFGAVRIGGPVMLEELTAALYRGMSVGAMIVCLGAATVLASPRRLLRYVPASLYEIGTTLVVGLTYAPQLMDDARAARAARRLRGRSGRGVREVGRVALPVLAGGLRRSLALAASMEMRGYGRPVSGRGGARRLAGSLVLAALVGIGIGVYGLMSAATARPAAAGCLVGGAALALGTLWWPGRRRRSSGRGSVDAGPVGIRQRRTIYRPDRWAGPEWLVVAGVTAAIGTVFAVGMAAPDALSPPTVPVQAPSLPWLAALGVAAAAAVVWATPVPPDRDRGSA